MPLSKSLFFSAAKRDRLFHAADLRKYKRLSTFYDEHLSLPRHVGFSKSDLCTRERGAIFPIIKRTLPLEASPALREFRQMVHRVEKNIERLPVSISTMGSTNTQGVSLEVPVLIAGGGPSGLLAAYLLSKLGGMEEGRKKDTRGKRPVRAFEATC